MHPGDSSLTEHLWLWNLIITIIASFVRKLINIIVSSMRL